MTPDFISRFAPKLMMKRDAGSPSAGLNTEELVDAGGAARPYISTNGTREYFGNASDYAARRDGLRGRLPDEPIVSGGLSAEQPQATPSPFGPRLADEPTLRAARPAFAGPRIGPQVRSARIPGIPNTHPTGRAAEVEATIMGGIQQGSINPMHGPESPMLSGQRQQIPDNMSLGDMLEHFGQGLSEQLSAMRNNARFRAPALDVPTINKPGILNNFRPPGSSTLPVSGGTRSAGRAGEVAAFLRSQQPPIRVTSVKRRGNAARRGHPAGNSIDVDPRDRVRALALIRNHFPDIPVEAFDIEAGQRFGPNVRSTGHHGHIDLGPAA